MKVVIEFGQQNLKSEFGILWYRGQMLKSRKTKKPKVFSRGLSDSRTHALYQAGLKFFSKSDFDTVSIAMIAKVAECSVGAFYERFPNKNAYLIFLIRNTFRTKINSLENNLPKIAHKKSNRKSVIEEIAEFLIDELSGEKTAGVIRVAFKLAPTHPEALTPITEYRAAANKIISEILKPNIQGRDARNRIEEALQILFSVIFDAIQQNYGPLQLNNVRMSAVLSKQFEAHLADKSKSSKGTVFNSTKPAHYKTQNKEIAIHPEEIARSPRDKRRETSPKAKSSKRRNVKLI
ncbi:TetR/AcrR family transcriptional regulator [Hyphococcus formosus]|uniref:TetR/AcrR family transcriptional regulator n=1 Tax=Hyphococcus formosus TaxID=3143534 RepID=UPI00398A70CB